jgi:hypothetical protein
MRTLSINKWFPLPRLGPEYFSELRRARVVYDSKLGFKITSETDVRSALSTLSRALGEDFELGRSCFICDNSIGGDEVSRIICTKCADSDDAYVIYALKFASLMDQL